MTTIIGNPNGFYLNHGTEKDVKNIKKQVDYNRIISRYSIRINLYLDYLMKEIKNLDNILIMDIGGGYGEIGLSFLRRFSNYKFKYILVDSYERLIYSWFIFKILHKNKKISLFYLKEDNEDIMKEKLNSYIKDNDILLIPKSYNNLLNNFKIKNDIYKIGLINYLLDGIDEKTINNYLNLINKNCKLFIEENICHPYKHQTHLDNMFLKEEIKPEIIYNSKESAMRKVYIRKNKKNKKNKKTNI